MTDTETLPSYSGDDTTCPKCGYDQANTIYRAARPRSLWEWNDQTITRGPLPERLQRNCSRCDYAWDEALATPARSAGPSCTCSLAPHAMTRPHADDCPALPPADKQGDQP